MPGSAQNPWATELKTRKKSASRKRSVPGKKGNAIIRKCMIILNYRVYYTYNKSNAPNVIQNNLAEKDVNSHIFIQC